MGGAMTGRWRDYPAAMIGKVPRPPQVFDVEKLPPWWPMEFEWTDAPVVIRSLADFRERYGERAAAVAVPAFEVGTYGGIYALTLEPARPRWKRILLWPRDRWVAWQFDHGRRW